jgi:hypothetical protein
MLTREYGEECIYGTSVFEWHDDSKKGSEIVD